IPLDAGVTHESESPKVMAGSADLLLSATGRANLGDAVAWIAEGHPLPRTITGGQLLRAVVALDADMPRRQQPFRRLALQVAPAAMDPASLIFNVPEFPRPPLFRTALAVRTAKSANGALSGLSADGVFAALREDPFAVEALCVIAGVSYSELAKRVR